MPHVTKSGDPDGFAPVFVLLLWMACAAVVAVVLMYRFQFNGPLSGEAEKWGQFGDYVGGTLNPILGFISVVALILTLAIQSRQLSISHEQLKLSRDELQATRQELARTADAQQATADALAAQAGYAARSAKISALGTALQVVDQELIRLGRDFAIERVRIANGVAEGRRRALLQELDEVLDQFRSPHERNT